MKSRMIYSQWKYSICLLVVMVFALSGLRAGIHNPVEVSKQIKVASQVSSGAILDITNKYGDLNFQSWDKDSIVVLITITATGSNEKSAEELLASIDVQRIVSKNYIRVMTEFHENKSKLGKQINLLLDQTRRLVGENRTTVNYKVFMPLNTRLKIENRFGNVILPTECAELEIDLQHGDLHADNVTLARKVKCYYGNAYFRYVKSGLIEQGFGNLVLDGGGDIHLVTKSTTSIIGEVTQLNLQSLHDTYIIDETGHLSGKADFTNLSVKHLTKSADITCKYGDLTVSKLANGFGNIDIQAEYTSVVVYAMTDSQFDFTIKTENSQGVRLPATALVATDEQTTNMRLVSGKQGKSSGLRAINISSKYGFIKIGVAE